MGPKCPLFDFESITLSLPESNIKVVLTSESVDEVLCCHHSDVSLQQYFHMVLFVFKVEGHSRNGIFFEIANKKITPS